MVSGMVIPYDARRYAYSSSRRRAGLGRDYWEALTDPMLNELRPRGVDARVPIALDRVTSTQLDETEASVAALLASCQDAASQVRERGEPQKAVFIARATRARAPSTNAPIATWRNCDPRDGCSG